MKIVIEYGSYTALYIIGDDNIIRNYADNTPVYVVNGSVIRKYADNTPVYTVYENTVLNYTGNTPVYFIKGHQIYKYFGSKPVYLVADYEDQSRDTATVHLPDDSSQGDPEGRGCMYWLGAYVGHIIKYTEGWIGLVLGVAGFIVAIATGRLHDIFGTVFFGFFFILFSGTVGASIGAARKFIRKIIVGSAVNSIRKIIVNLRTKNRQK